MSDIEALELDYTPPIVNFNNLVMGTGERLIWQLGTVLDDDTFVPENLTGRAASIVFAPGGMNQLRQPLAVDGPLGQLTCILPAQLRMQVRYVVLVEDLPSGRRRPRVTGLLTPGQIVLPPTGTPP